MIEFVTLDGVSLDLDPGAEFEITLENPVFQDDRMPTAWSTAVAFLPTSTNNAVFGYVHALMLEPSVKKVPVTFFAGGIPVSSGNLEYDGMEDGRLNYTYTSVVSGDDLEAKLYELGGFHMTGTPSDILATINGGQVHVHAPMMVNSAMTGCFTQARTDGTGTPVSVDEKYCNYPENTEMDGFLPAFELGALLKDGLPSMLFDSSILDFLEMVCMVGTERRSAEVVRRNSAIRVNLCSYLPDVTVKDLLLEVTKMMALAVFSDGNHLRMRPMADVLASGVYDDWDGIVSDLYQLSLEPGKSYRFAFGGNSGEDTYSENDPDTDPPTEVDTLYQVISGWAEGTDYFNVKHKDTGDIYSVLCARIVVSGTDHEKNYLVDNVHSGLSESVGTGDGEDAENAECRFKVVRCAPVKYTVPSGTTHYNYRRLCPVISLPASSDRSSDMVIGLLVEKQLCDKGVVFKLGSTDEIRISQSLSPQSVYDTFQKTYAEWLSGSRTVVKADLDLSPDRLAIFRMWQKVLIRGRAFFVKTLSVRFSAASDVVTATGEFVSA